MKNRLSIILTILLIAMSVIFVFMGKDIMELKNSNEVSIEAIQTLQTENKELHDNIATLENDKEVLKRQIDDLIAEKTQLEDKVKELSVQKTTTVPESKGTNQQTTKEENKKADETASKQSNDEKIAYLTFDDGPSANTVQILDILKQYNIKATFFVNGNASMKDLYKRIVNEGHSIGNHTYSHNYENIYSSVDAYVADMNKLNNLLKETTGVTPTIVRFPGGSNNTVSNKYGGTDIMNQIVKKVANMGYQYFDWNVSSTDAEKVKQDKDVIVKSTLDGAKNKTKIVVLMHDAGTKTTTVEALPEIIDGLIKQGFKFESLDKNSYAPHFLKVD